MAKQRTLVLARTSALRAPALAVSVAVLLAACGQQQVVKQKQAPLPPVSPAPEHVAVLHMAPGTNPIAVRAAGNSMAVSRATPRVEVRPLQANREKYGEISTNPVRETAKEPVSTFSIDVDTGSYSNVRRFLTQGQLPPVDAVRVEELVNYFPYQYAQKDPAGRPFTVQTEVVQSPWKGDAQLLRIGIGAVNQSLGSLLPANLVFLIDVSGSMSGYNKLDLVKKTLSLLVQQLRPQDKVTIITYASGEQLVLPPTSGADKEAIMQAIHPLRASGATAGADAIQMAYREAAKSFIPNGINRIFLATDGDFNVGITDFKTLKGMVAEKRKAGISLTTLGFGIDNYNERLMEQLADAGDGNYSYIDNEREARKVLKDQLTSTLATVAQDVKIQIEFNPATVSQYRLIGYENRMLNKEDFNNDNVDAGDIGAGHTVTALHEIIPAGKSGWMPASRYQPAAKTPAELNQEYAYINIRYKPVGASKSELISTPVPISTKPLQQASSDTRFAVAVAAYGQLLRGGQYTGKWGWSDTRTLAQGALGKDEFGLRAEFVELLQAAESLSTKKPVAKAESGQN